MVNYTLAFIFLSYKSKKIPGFPISCCKNPGTGKSVILIQWPKAIKPETLYFCL